MAPSLQAAQHDLNKQQLNSSLKHKLQARPTKTDLREHQIFRDLSPVIDAPVRQLDRKRISGVVSNNVEDRKAVGAGPSFVNTGAPNL